MIKEITKRLQKVEITEDIAEGLVKNCCPARMGLDSEYIETCKSNDECMGCWAKALGIEGE